MAKYITEVLRELNEDTSLFQTTYKKNGDGGPLGIVFKHAYMPQYRFLLPEGEPPFRKSTEPLGVTPGNFINEIRRFYHLCRTDISPVRREQLFVQILESIHPDEAKILIAIKDQKLYELYPNLTAYVVGQAGFIPPVDPPVAQETTTAKKVSKPRGRKKKTEPGTQVLDQE